MLCHTMEGDRDQYRSALQKSVTLLELRWCGWSQISRKAVNEWSEGQWWCMILLTCVDGECVGSSVCPMWSTVYQRSNARFAI